MKQTNLDKQVKKYLNGNSDAFEIIYEETKKYVSCIKSSIVI